MGGEDRLTAHPVFISYATADRKQALAVCDALELQGIGCWIACRDVEAGDNYQEAIVRAIRAAPVMVLVFTEAANRSDEIKKELSLASRCHITVIALRIDDVEPSDAFAYELATRQWIDASEGLERSIEMLARRIEQVSTDGSGLLRAPPLQRAGAHGRVRIPVRHLALVAGIAALLLAAGWFLLRPETTAPATTMVRLASFDRLSGDLPQGISEALRDEIIAAFSDDGVVTISIAPQSISGSAPSYSLGGTVRRQENQIKVIARLTDDRSGVTIWSNAFSYDAKDAGLVPRRVAVDAGNLVRCGLFGASTYGKRLPDAAATAYFQTCHNLGLVVVEPEKALDAAHKTVAAAPDFSWGWSAVEMAAFLASQATDSEERRNALRKEAMAAAGKALSIDPTNSEALTYKSLLIGDRQFAEREKLLRLALKARPLACGCEHHIYGEFLSEVGRLEEAAQEFQRSVDVMPLNSSSQAALGQMQLMLGRPGEAKRHIDASVELQTDPDARNQLTVALAPISGDYAAAERVAQNPNAPVPEKVRNALLSAFGALKSGDTAAKARAAQQISALPPRNQGGMATMLLGALGSNRQALANIEAAAAQGRQGVTSWLFLPSLAGARRDPAFGSVAERLGLVAYWRTTKTRPDFCAADGAPPFCKTL